MTFSPGNGPVGAPNLTAGMVVQDGVGHLASTADATLTPTASWSAQQAQWASQQGAGLFTFAQGGTPATATATANRNMLYALGSYLLRANGQDTFDFTSGGYGAYHPYYAATEVPIGLPLGASYADGSLQRRDFQNGVVLVNPSTVTSVPYPFGNILFVLGNGAVSARCRRTSRRWRRPTWRRPASPSPRARRSSPSSPHPRVSRRRSGRA